jgi:hypothetical protein
MIYKLRLCAREKFYQAKTTPAAPVPAHPECARPRAQQRGTAQNGDGLVNAPRNLNIAVAGDGHTPPANWSSALTRPAATLSHPMGGGWGAEGELFAAALKNLRLDWPDAPPQNGKRALVVLSPEARMRAVVKPLFLTP